MDRFAYGQAYGIESTGKSMLLVFSFVGFSVFLLFSFLFLPCFLPPSTEV
jgi:hypothetical protein